MVDEPRRRFLVSLLAGGIMLPILNKGIGAGWASRLAEFLSGLNPVRDPARIVSNAEKSGISRWRYEWVMVIDLERCDGCGLCEEACISAHQPLPGQTWMKVYMLRAEDGTISPLPRPCMQCQNAPCVNVCPVGANYYNEDGIVIIDKGRCIGCRMCMAACPYGARYFNWRAPDGGVKEPHGEEEVHPVGVVEKCMFCYKLLEEGGLPPCVRACPMRAIYMGERKQDVMTNGLETLRLSKVLEEREAFRLLEELGTEPRVYYLPGRRGKGCLEGLEAPLEP